MFIYNRGLWLPSIRLAIDADRRQPQGFVSHAHSDHMARHELALLTPATAALYFQRLGKRPVRLMPYGERIELGDLRLTAFPAGHMLGSAMLLAESASHRMLYTGDFCLTPGRTSGPPVSLPRADILVMESTFGDPQFCLPPRRVCEVQLIELVRTAIGAGRPPVIHAYAAGKAQDVCRLLCDHGIPTLQHPAVARISRVYAELGRQVGPIHEYRGSWNRESAIVAPPRRHARRLSLPRQSVSIAATGWALLPETRRRWGVDYAVALSDHADFPQLLKCVEEVNPQIVFCTHGPKSFVEQLCQRGWNAFVLDDRSLSRWHDLSRA